MEKKNYGAIDGLRMIASLGIVMMHIRANSKYRITGYVYNTIIPSFTNFVFLFMTISAFGMCCGYYEKILNNVVSLSKFYGKRFKKIFPFFGILVLLDIVLSPSIASIYEGFADLTLVFGFLQKPISVIGVGWFLGLVFIFYLIFPFFCVLLENKRRAWLVFVISLMYNFVCGNYFEVGRSNILYSACFFLAGGLIFLYQDQIVKLNQWIILGTAGCVIILYYVIGGNVMMCLLVSSALMIYAIVKRGGLLENRITKFFSSISMEMFLSHMVIFRCAERLRINQIFGNGWSQYIVTVVFVIVGTSVFSVVMQRSISKMTDLVSVKERSICQK